MLRKLLPLLLLCPLVTAKPLRGDVDRLARPYVDGQLLVGMVVGVIAAPDGDVLITGYGRVALDRDGAPDANTVYEIGSVSKVFTGVLLAIMVQGGEVRLDQPLEELLPGDVKVPARDERKITLVDLATHSSGLPRMPDNFAPKDPKNPYADYTPELLYAFLSGHALTRAPEDKYEYSNLGMGLLGHALARKAKQSYEELLTARITGPLGMKSTAVVCTPEMRKRLAPGYNAQGDPVGNWDIPTLGGAGGIRSTAADMVRFLQANLAREPTALNGALVAAREVRFTPKEPVAHGLGLGWHISPVGARWHNGQTGGYHSFAAVDTRQRIAVVVLSNSGTGAVDRLGSQLLRMLGGEKVEPLAVRKEVPVPAKVLESYVGTYRLLPDFTLTVTIDQGRLMVQATGQPRFQVFAESKTEFFYKVVDARITFVRDAKGKVAELILHQHGSALHARRE